MASASRGRSIPEITQGPIAAKLECRIGVHPKAPTIVPRSPCCEVTAWPRAGWTAQPVWPCMAAPFTCIAEVQTSSSVSGPHLETVTAGGQF